MEKKQILLDGAFGTQLWKRSGRSDPTWTYNITDPGIVTQIHRDYIEAGSGMILTNTFSTNRINLGKKASVKAVTEAAVRCAKEAVSGTDAKIGLDIGPLTDFMEPFGELSREEVENTFDEVIKAGVSAGVDGIVFETFMDLSMLACGVETALPYGLPVIASMTFKEDGHTIMGNTPEEVVRTLSAYPLAGIGLNCSAGPKDTLPVAQAFARLTDLPVYYKPNAGMPVKTKEGTVYDMTEEEFADGIRPALSFVTYIGGCCGTSPAYIAKIAEMLTRQRKSVLRSARE